MKIYHKLINRILNFIFFLSNRKIQNKIIDKNARNFFKFQNRAKILDDLGDVRSAMHLNSKSYEHLLLFIDYCLVLDIDAVEKLKSYKNNERF